MVCGWEGWGEENISEENKEKIKSKLSTNMAFNIKHKHRWLTFVSLIVMARQRVQYVILIENIIYIK